MTTEVIGMSESNVLEISLGVIFGLIVVCVAIVVALLIALVSWKRKKATLERTIR